MSPMWKMFIALGIQLAIMGLRRLPIDQTRIDAILGQIDDVVGQIRTEMKK